MTVTRLAHLEFLANKWLPRIGMAHWKVIIEIGGELGEDSLMEISRQEQGLHIAFINVAAWVVGEAEKPSHILSTDDPEQALVHELCHLLFNDVAKYSRDMAERTLGDQALEMFCLALTRMEEQNVDLLARGLVDTWGLEA